MSDKASSNSAETQEKSGADDTPKGGAPLADHGAAPSPSLDTEMNPGPHQEQGGMRS